MKNVIGRRWAEASVSDGCCCDELGQAGRGEEGRRKRRKERRSRRGVKEGFLTSDPFVSPQDSEGNRASVDPKQTADVYASGQVSVHGDAPPPLRHLLIPNVPACFRIGTGFRRSPGGQRATRRSCVGRRDGGKGRDLKRCCDWLQMMSPLQTNKQTDKQQSRAERLETRKYFLHQSLCQVMNHLLPPPSTLPPPPPGWSQCCH